MSDERAKKSDWAATFLGRLILIAWVSAILYEAFDFFPLMRRVCLFFGPWACILALLHGVSLLVIRKQGLFLVLLLLTLPPTFLYGMILKNIAAERQWIETSTGAPENPAETTLPETAPNPAISHPTAER